MPILYAIIAVIVLLVLNKKPTATVTALTPSTPSTASTLSSLPKQQTNILSGLAGLPIKPIIKAAGGIIAGGGASGLLAGGAGLLETTPIEALTVANPLTAGGLLTASGEIPATVGASVGQAAIVEQATQQAATIAPLAEASTIGALGILGIGAGLGFGLVELGNLVLGPGEQDIKDPFTYNQSLIASGIIKAGGAGGTILDSEGKPLKQLQ